MRQSRHEFCCRRRNENFIRPARELNVSHRRFGSVVPQIRAYRLARNSLKSQRRDELLRTARHYDLYFGAALDQAPDQIRTLVRGDPTGHTENDFARLRAHAKNYGRAFGYRQTPARMLAFQIGMGERTPNFAANAAEMLTEATGYGLQTQQPHSPLRYWDVH